MTHPDVAAAMERIKPVLDEIDNASRDQLTRLKNLIERTQGATRDRYYEEFRAVADSVRRQKRLVMQPVLDLANMLPTPIVIPTEELIKVIKQ